MTYTHYIAHSISKIQTARPTGKCLCGEGTRFTRIRRHGPECRATKPVSQERERSSNAVVGGEIDRGLCIHRRGRLMRRPNAIPGQFDSASCSTCFLTHGWCRLCHGLGRHASCGILMPSSFCGFPHTVLRRGRVACLAFAFAGVLPFVPCLVQRENADGEQLALLRRWVGGKLHTVVKYRSESNTAPRGEASLLCHA